MSRDEKPEGYIDAEKQASIVSGRDWLLQRRVLAAVFLLVVIGIGLSGAYLLGLQERLVETIARNNAELSSSTLREIRTLYTSEVVGPARASGMIVTHDYADQDGAIPLPATLSILIGNSIDTAGDSSARLYSDYPFPWRAKSGGPRDTFEIEAIRALRENPLLTISRIEERDGRSFLRYATADLMREGCVNCHNTHPESPKTDWKLGDVRGVLEVNLPLEAKESKTKATFRGVLALFLAMVSIGLLTLALFAGQLRTKSIVAGRLAAKTAEANRELAKQILERERTEKLRQALEEKVLHAQKLESLGLLAGGIAHDVNNLLMGILGNADLAGEDIEEGSTARTGLDGVERAVSEARSLTRQLLAYAGRGQARSVGVELSAFVREGQGLLATSRGKRSSLSYELADDLPGIEVDPAQLQQVVLNLVTNAMDSLKNKGGRGDVTVRTGLMFATKSYLASCLLGSELPEAEYVFLEVEDEGSGVEVALITKIFDPFFSTKSEGRGLGLAALQGIVRSHGAALSLVTAVGKGTCFRVLFAPSEKPLQTRFSADSDRPSIVRGETVLVVDDTDSVREITSALLARVGYEVVGVSSGEEAVDRIQTLGEDIDYVVLDMRMPGMGGAEACRLIHQIRPNLPVILVSGDAGGDEVLELTSTSHTTYLQKPYRLNSLLQAMHDLRKTSTEDNIGE